MKYPKINSLWKRQQFQKDLPKGSHGDLIQGEYSQEEFGSIKKWRVDEKIDGTNIRIIYKDGKVDFGGRTDDAQLPPHLLKYLQTSFNDGLLAQVFPIAIDEPYPTVVLFGEGYGPKIQAVGGNYSKSVGFKLFDIFINGWWLKREDVTFSAKQLGIEMVPEVGVMTEDEIVLFVTNKPSSLCSLYPQMMEGVVCRSDPLMLTRRGDPIMFKLKCREF